MKTTSSSTDYKQLDTELFTKIYTATIECFNLSATDYPCSKGVKQRWIDIADIWHQLTYVSEDSCTPKCYSVLDHALHIIYCDLPITTLPPDQQTLVELVAEALLTSKIAFNSFRRHGLFYLAFRCVMNLAYIGNHSACTCKKKNSTLSQVFLKYQISRFYYLLFYRHAEAPSLNLENATWREIRQAKKHADIRAYCLAFETAIKFLIPGTTKWSNEQWLNERNIFRALKRRYGKDWKSTPMEFDCLITALMEMLYYERSIYLRYLLQIKDMPSALIKHIWPDNTDKCLQELFAKSATQAKIAATKLDKKLILSPSYTDELLRTSWLFGEMMNNLDSLPKKVKEKVFTLALIS